MRKLFVVSAQLLILALVLAAWQLLPTLGLISPFIIPPLSSVIQAGMRLAVDPTYVPSGLYTNLFAYLEEIGASYGIVVVIGVSLGILMGIFKMLGDVLEPAILAIYAIPHVIFYPIFILTLGFGSSSKIAYALLSGLTITLVSILAYTRQLDPNYIKVARVNGATVRQMVFYVVIPALIPGVAAALQLGLALVIIGVTVAETLASSQGLGYLINWSTFLIKPAILLAVIVITIAVALAMNLLNTFVLRTLTRWMR